MVIDNILKDFRTLKEEISDDTNYCLEIFNTTVDINDVPEDVYYSARAFTSIINNIVNRKTKYIFYILDNHIELLEFLQTFDKKYLLGIESLLAEKCSAEIIFAQELADDNIDIINFLFYEVK